MTEEEAKQKWCHERAKAAAARGHDPFCEDANCIASDCMMWKWEYEEICTESVMDVAGTCYRKKTDNGYCGLAK